MQPESIKKLTELFSKFPTVGPRTAGRFVFYLMGLPQKNLQELTEAMALLKQNTKQCIFCFSYFEIFSQGLKLNLCPMCANKTRNKNILCVIEKEIDLEAIEKTKCFKGFYFILGGLLFPLKKKVVANLRIQELKERLQNPEKFGINQADFKEIILALNPTTEGETTSLYLERELKGINIKMTRLARGLPSGGELEYADIETLSSALESRK